MTLQQSEEFTFRRISLTWSTYKKQEQHGKLAVAMQKKGKP